MNALSKRRAFAGISQTARLDIVGAYDVADRFQVLTNDFEGHDQRVW
ncbi:MAG: hypothetical protein IPL27_26195 [Lewinellaceae bacterium]|nr:hypothetical protein [Lewinellaceae bacterium]